MRFRLLHSSDVADVRLPAVGLHNVQNALVASLGFPPRPPVAPPAEPGQHIDRTPQIGHRDQSACEHPGLVATEQLYLAYQRGLRRTGTQQPLFARQRAATPLAHDVDPKAIVAAGNDSTGERSIVAQPGMHQQPGARQSACTRRGPASLATAGCCETIKSRHHGRTSGKRELSHAAAGLQQRIAAADDTAILHPPAKCSARCYTSAYCTLCPIKRCINGATQPGCSSSNLSAKACTCGTMSWSRSRSAIRNCISPV